MPKGGDKFGKGASKRRKQLQDARYKKKFCSKALHDAQELPILSSEAAHENFQGTAQSDLTDPSTADQSGTTASMRNARSNVADLGIAGLSGSTTPLNDHAPGQQDLHVQGICCQTTCHPPALLTQQVQKISFLTLSKDSSHGNACVSRSEAGSKQIPATKSCADADSPASISSDCGQPQSVLDHTISTARAALSSSHPRLGRASPNATPPSAIIQRAAEKNVHLQGEVIRLREENKSLRDQLKALRRRADTDDSSIAVAQLREQILASEKRTQDLEKNLASKVASIESIKKRRKKAVNLTWVDNIEKPQKVRLRPASSSKGAKLFYHIPTSRTPVTTATKRTLRKKANCLSSVLDQLAGGRFPRERAKVLSAYLQSDPLTWHALKEDAKLNIGFSKLTAEQTADLQHQAGLGFAQVRTIRSSLIQHEANVLAPESEVRKIFKTRELQTEMLTETAKLIETQSVQLPNGKKKLQKVEVERTLQRAASLIGLMKAAWLKTKANCRLYDHQHFKKSIFMAIGGDKGGTTTKVVISYLNVENPASTDNLHILAMYEGDDSAENLRRVLEKYSDEWPEAMAMSLEYPVNDTGTEMRPIVPFLYGDLMFQNHFLGLRGPRSSHPCVHCKVPLRELTKLPQRFPPRSLRQHRIAVRHLELTGRFKDGVAELPIFSIHTTQLVPPVLHLYLGLGTNLLDRIESEAQKLDLKITDDDGKRKLREYKTISAEVSRIEKQYDEAMEAVKAHSDLLDIVTQRSGAEEDESSQCEADVCFAETFRSKKFGDTAECIICDCCDKWYHMECCLIFTAVDQATMKREDVQWQCPPCQGIRMDRANIIASIKVALEEATAIEEQQRLAYEEALSKKQTYQDLVIQKKGTATGAFNDALRSLGIDRGAFQGGVFIGNHIRKAINIEKKGPETVTACLESSPALQRKYKSLLTQLDKVRKLMCLARFLEDEEVNELKAACRKFGKLFAQYRSNETVTPKLHILVHHVPQFVEKWRTVGLITEHGIEALHGEINKINLRYACIRDISRRMSLVVKEHERRQTGHRNKKNSTR